MKQIKSIELADVIRHHSTCRSFGNELVIIEMDGSSFHKPDNEKEGPVRFNVFSILMICRGRVEVMIDDVWFHATENSLLDIMDRHLLNGIRLSPDFKGYHILASKNILSETLFNSRRPPVASIATMRMIPIHQISTAEMSLLERMTLRILDSMDRKDHAWQRDLVMNDLRGFYIEMKNVVFRSNKEHDKEILPSRDELLFLFIQLLDKHCKEEHSVAFYAGELCVTPQHLSNVLKNLSGKTVSKWIDEALMRESQLCLRDRNLTLQQITDLLCFSDQSSFGKFFKKHSGMSPLLYRTSVGI